MKFYKRDPDRALAGMAELTLKQRGAYNSILDLLYSRDGDVPDDDRRVAKMIACHWREWAALKKQLIELGKIWVEGGRLTAKRVQETLKEAADFSQAQSKRASERWEKSENNKQNNEPPMRGGNALTPTPIATPTPTKKDISVEFEKFWNSYPRKVAKKAALRAFSVSIREATIEEILSALLADAANWREERFIPHPATWLNGGRYLDRANNPTKTYRPPGSEHDRP